MKLKFLLSLLLFVFCVNLTVSAQDSTTITPGTPIMAELQANQQSVRYSFEAQAGDSVEVLLTSNIFDTFVSLLDGSNTELIFSDDKVLVSDTNSYISNFTIPANGTHFIEVTSSRNRISGADGDSGAFVLTLILSRPTNVVAPTEDPFELGISFFERRMYEQAIAAFTEAIEAAPTNPQIFNKRGETYFLTGNHELALADYNRAIGLDLNYAPAYVNRADFYFNQGNEEKGIENYTRAVQLDTTYTDRYEALAMAYAIKGDITQYERTLAWDIVIKDDDVSIMAGDYRLEVTRIYRLEQIASDQPALGMYLVLEVTLHNYSSSEACLRVDNLSVLLEGNLILPGKLYQLREDQYRGMTYLPSEGENVYCIPGYQSWDTFLAYDLPRELTAVNMNFNLPDEEAIFKLWLNEGDEGEYIFALADLNGSPQVRIGEIRETGYADEILDVEIYERDNCIGRATLSTEIRYEQQISREISVGNSWSLGVAIGPTIGTPAVFGLIPTAELQFIVEGQYTRSTTQTNEKTLIAARSEMLSILPGERASYEVTWVLVTVEGYIEVIDGNNIFQAPFTITDRIRSDIVPLETLPCSN